jgi:hypothetical protein
MEGQTCRINGLRWMTVGFAVIAFDLLAWEAVRMFHYTARAEYSTRLILLCGWLLLLCGALRLRSQLGRMRKQRGAAFPRQEDESQPRRRFRPARVQTAMATLPPLDSAQERRLRHSCGFLLGTVLVALVLIAVSLPVLHAALARNSDIEAYTGFAVLLLEYLALLALLFAYRQAVTSAGILAEAMGAERLARRCGRRGTLPCVGILFCLVLMPLSHLFPTPTHGYIYAGVLDLAALILQLLLCGRLLRTSEEAAHTPVGGFVPSVRESDAAQREGGSTLNERTRDGSK